MIKQKNYLEKSVWGKKSIDRTVKGIIFAKQRKSLHIKWLDKNLIWLIILIAIIGSFFTAFGVLPLLFVLKGALSYGALGFIGIIMGILFEFLIANLESIEKHHHLAILLIIPIISVVNFILVIQGVESHGINLSINSVIGGIVYSVFFLMPYVVYEFYMKNRL